MVKRQVVLPIGSWVYDDLPVSQHISLPMPVVLYVAFGVLFMRLHHKIIIAVAIIYSFALGVAIMQGFMRTELWKKLLSYEMAIEDEYGR